MILQILLFITGAALLVIGADKLVTVAASLARKLSVSELTIGLTVVAVGTSIPELASSIVASFRHESDIVIGNIIGANILNICLILGICATLTPLRTDRKMLLSDGSIMLFVATLLSLFMVNHFVGRLEAAVLVVFYFVYVMFLFESQSSSIAAYEFRHFVRYLIGCGYVRQMMHRLRNSVTHDYSALRTAGRELLFIALGIAAVITGAYLFIDQALYFADLLQIPKTIIAVTLVAFGTTLPELSVSVAAVTRGLHTIAIGNIIGSNIVNILLIIGVAGIINPLTIQPITFGFTLPFLIGVSALLLVFIRTGWSISRLEGALLLTSYAVFLTILFSGTF
jgi:cation:H+ antiporter